MKKTLAMHTHFSIETSRFASDADKIGFTVENKSLSEHLAFMDQAGITFSVLTCTTLKYLDSKDSANV